MSLASFARLAAACLGASLLAAPAYAGGIGIVGTVGAQTDRVYWYDADDLEQHHVNNMLLNYGTGIEVVLGDRDDRIIGVMRGYWMQDAPQQNPAQGKDDRVANVRDNPRNVGMAIFGLQWGFLGSPDAFQLYANTGLGSGFLTTDHSEFVAGALGVGAQYRLSPNLAVLGDIDYTMRYRKSFSHGAATYVSLRYLFD